MTERNQDMAIETFHTLIAKNKRNTAILIFCFLVFFVLLGLLIGLVWGGGDAQMAIGIAAGAGILAFFLTLASYFHGSSAILGMSKAREISHDDDPELFNVVEEMSIAAGLPMPKVYVIDDSAMNAFATGRNPQNAAVAITTGLREKLTRDELQGVIAHEMSHVRHYDILYAMLVAVMVGVIVMLCDIFLRSVWYGGGRRRSRGRDKDGGQILLVILAVVLAILAPILARIIQMAISRQREYLADAGAVALTRNPHGIAGALIKLGGDEEVLEVASRATAPLFIVHPIKTLEARASNFMMTHPPIEDRVKRILSLTI